MLARAGKNRGQSGPRHLFTGKCTLTHVLNLLMIGAGWYLHLHTLVRRANGGTAHAQETFWDGWTRLRAEYDRRIPA